ncbi:class I SAM-dependent methyltransferase [Motilimonas cestriensis]|uniref:class I SAM-dependent methyltransferase n=1 Tax=Motilimonas cestriensis TaxID=2742685 RepID=UPI003DA63C9F
MAFYEKPMPISAFDAKFEAQKIAFAPITFQVARCLLKFNILALVDSADGQGCSLTELASQTEVSEYGVSVLLDMGLSMGLVWQQDGRFYLDKIGHFLLHDEMAQKNLNFSHDVCYQGLFDLDKAIETGKPAGLKALGDWDTIYPGLSQLPEQIKASWFEFDHFYSDRAFPEVLPLLFAHKPQHILDVGGNTGKWALACTGYDATVKVTIMDLPGQLKIAMDNAEQAQVSDRVFGFATDLLDEDRGFYQGADTIWMSQFLDCFSPPQILSILKRAAKVMGFDCRLYILETFWDRQPFAAGAYCVNATSIYFTAIANGNSRMYHSRDMLDLLQQAGLYVDESRDELGLGHTLLCCRLKPISG